LTPLWAVQIVAADEPFLAEVLIEAADQQSAAAAVQNLVAPLRVARQIGPMSWHYAALVTAEVREITA
jgi:hypothetical protein